MKHQLSICAIVRNEGGYIEEWINYHLLQGVQHFYLYNNGSVDNTEDIISRYGDVVSYKNWQVYPGQMPAYANALEWTVDKTKWLAFIDIDEFIYSPSGEGLRYHLSMLEESDRAAGLAIHWHLFGSNGQEDKQDGLVIERFPMRQSDVNPHVKTIVQPEYTLRPLDPHSFEFAKGLCCVDEHGLSLPKHYSVMEGTADNFAIAHYHTKSRAEARARWKQPRADTGTMRDFGFSFDAHDRNEVTDTTLAKFAEEVERMMRH